jgi:hypothetical protein
VADFDVQQVREAAARALFDDSYRDRAATERDYIWPQLNLETSEWPRQADAAMAVIVPAVTARIRALHRPYTVSAGTYCKHSGSRWPCGTSRLLDQIEAAVRGEQ